MLQIKHHMKAVLTVRIRCTNSALDSGSFSVRSARRYLSDLFSLFCSLGSVGDNHVFRFNNPEEVRKQRDRATQKTNMQLSVSAADLEASEAPPSPTSSADDEFDIDWNFAKREAALARLGLDPALDNLPDDDLNKLYEKITKVKTMRDHNSKSRPESSLSQADDIWSETSRPQTSDAFTDDTSLYAVPSWGGSPAVDGPLKDVQHQLETRLQEITGDSTEAEDLKIEKEHMEHQLRIVRVQMKRLIDARSRGDVDSAGLDFEPVIFSARQLRLIRKVLNRWRSHRSFSMAEVILTNAVMMKEANIIRLVLPFISYSPVMTNLWIWQQGTWQGSVVQLHNRIGRITCRTDIFCRYHCGPGGVR